jgi:predicted helicase
MPRQPKNKPQRVQLKHPVLRLIRSAHLEVVQQVKDSDTPCLALWEEEVKEKARTIDWPGIKDEDRLTFKGDALELLSEFMLKSCSWNPKHGITDYNPVSIRDDYGVDATGINAAGNVTAIQCKFRSNPSRLIHYADLARTFTQGIIQYGLDPAAKKNLWLFTNTEGANANSKKILGSRLHVLDRSHLRKQVDNNQAFWDSFYESILKS